MCLMEVVRSPVSAFFTSELEWRVRAGGYVGFAKALLIFYVQLLKR
jgi:hypothetical protein